LPGDQIVKQNFVKHSISLKSLESNSGLDKLDSTTSLCKHMLHTRDKYRKT